MSAVTSPAKSPTRPIWAEISESHLLHNYRFLRQRAGTDTELLAVVKANAYGHSLEICARVLAEDGAQWLGVTSVEEAVALRGICPTARIVAFSGVWPGEADAVIEHGLTPVVWDEGHFNLLEKAARRLSLGARKVPVHLEIDTGMSRQGVQLPDLPAALRRFGENSPLKLEAVMTHFHSPDETAPTASQMQEFAAAVEAIVGMGIRPEFLSAGSSADVLSQSTRAVTELARRIGARRMVRTGIALYGYAPQREGSTGLEPVLTWKTRVTSVREIEIGTTAGYGATFTARRRTRLALLPAGYADGLSRLLSNKGWALVHGRRAPIAGRVSMDQTIVDVTDVPKVAAGDEAVLIGAQDGEQITAADLAELTGTIPYEILCAIAPRVPRELVS